MQKNELIPSKTPFLTGDDVQTKRAEILHYFHQTFSIYENLFLCLASEAAYFQRPNMLRHPLIFYYGHTAVFFINKLNISNLVAGPVDAELEKMLAVGVDEMSWDDLDQSHYTWPTVPQVTQYRNKVRELVSDFIATCEIKLPITQTDPLWIILMGIEHERIHLETSSVLIRELQLKHTTKQPAWQRCLHSGPAPKNSLIPVAGATAKLGKSTDNPLYGWDNEYGSQITEVPAFAASKYLVSNGEFLEFVEDGGYQTKNYWSEEGWNWREFCQAAHPKFWVANEKGYAYRSMVEEFDMPWNWPVEINYLEAEAFCQWKSAKTGTHTRMPSEAEWSLLRQMVPEDQPDWAQAPGNLNLEHFASSCPVDRFAFAGGFFDIIGNVWQWTTTRFDGFAGFAPHPAYDDFSTPTFDGRHNLFKGGCWASTGNYAIRDSRYAFRRHFFQHAGLRYLQSTD
ncbi:Glutamate synthase [NADPH] large chain [hydrothermal vent metagenome]|uniref:Glutamate synthase [NADPH] large chain n=1 Tax=hydrothermal vent metagenome TaxID=652676 RepID=A0A3B0SDC6_9ZZZZ